MAKNTNNKEKSKAQSKAKNKTLPKILIPVVSVVLILAITAGIILISKFSGGKTPSDTLKYLENGKLKYDDNAVVLNPDGQQGGDIKEVDDGLISLSHKNQAFSSDGENFDCYIKNNIDNKYDLYIAIYKDQTAKEQLYLSGLIPPGSGLDRFTSEIKLDKGDYDALLVVTQVEDDHATIHGGQLFLSLHLKVGS